MSNLHFTSVCHRLFHNKFGIRFALTGILFAALAGLADILGFGSHIRDDVIDIFFGQWQMVGILASFALSSAGVLLYVVAGLPYAKSAPTEALNNPSDYPVPADDFFDDETIPSRPKNTIHEQS